mmetsp:Transcript_10560/g.20981  ORF Transcript_10560/g.20981 Transcript_10560/m.20981 type:complete len:244 (-) Transcript_10560:871-1602(-)
MVETRRRAASRSKSKSPARSGQKSARSKPKLSKTKATGAKALSRTLFPSKGLYPTIAVSDSVNAGGHYVAAYICAQSGYSEAAWGFLSVAVAATIGVLRFGFDEDLFADANGATADFAAYVGLPLVGKAFTAQLAGYSPVFGFLSGIDSIAYVFFLSMFEQVVRSTKLKDDLKVLPNVFLYVIPVALASWNKADWSCLAGLALFVFAAVVIGPAREETLLGVRRENLFHYGIGPAAVLIAKGL